MIQPFRMFRSLLSERYLKRCIYWRRHAVVHTPLFVPNSLQPLEPRMLFAADPVFLLNVGGPSVVSVGGQVWAEDSDASPSALQTVVGTTTASIASPINLSDPSVLVDTPGVIFQSQRVGPANGGLPMSYDFIVDPGTYEVNLFFAELDTPAPITGDRTFDVVAEGQDQLISYDIVEQVGGGTGVVETFEVPVTDGTLDLDFVIANSEVVLNGIEITQVSTLSVSSTLVDLGETQVGTIAKATITLTNEGPVGAEDITISAADVTGANAAQFGAVFDATNGLTLAPGQSADLTVFFAPDSDNGNNSALLTLTHDGANPASDIALSADSAPAQNIDFGKSQVQGLLPGLLPTTVQFGPDGRFYAGHLDGTIVAYTIERNAANDYSVTSADVITLIKDLPNHDDDGTPRADVNDRLVTGIYVAGTPANPEIYVGSSDPRLTGGGQSGGDTGLDTNSGVISKLTFNGSNWEKIDLVRGLPRSEADHALNGIQITDDNILLVSIGGNTNMGAPSNNFAFLSEYALDTAIIGIDLDVVEALPTQIDINGQAYKYDLPTLDDEDRDFDGSGSDEDLAAGIQDVFGGNDGKNQARLVTGGPVFVYASGFRNPYDLVITGEGLLYAIDNGPNAGWGGSPIFDSGEVTNQTSEPGISLPDNLHIVTPGAYYGHPNPTRANRDNTFNATNPQSPVDPGSENPEEAFYLAPQGSNQNTYPEDDALATFENSTNGLTQYTASNFGGALQGDLLLTSLSNTLERVKLDASSAGVFVKDTLINNVGQYILDVTAVGDTGVFPGTVWVTDLFGAAIYVFEPADFDGEGGGGVVNPIDLDDDGYTNQDEIDNGTNPNSGADTPNDADSDFISNLNDPDDDNDSPDQLALIDINDPFANDTQNGLENIGGYALSFDTEDPNRGNLLGLGFTGVMTNGTSDYESLFDSNNLTAGGAAGVLTVDVVSSGTALGADNNQENAFQFGVNLNGTTEPLSARTRVNTPWSGLAPVAGQQIGFYVGTGDQSNYLELYIDGDGSVKLLSEVNDVPTILASAPIALAGATAIDLILDLDPTTGQVTARYILDGNPAVTVGSTTIPVAWYNGGDAMAVGVISTDQSVGGDSFFATYDLLSIAPSEVVLSAGPDQTVDAGQVITLDGSALDDGLPQPLEVQWTQISGPENVTINDASSVTATATLPLYGIYIFEITATDGLNTKTDQVVITAQGTSAPQDVELIVEPGLGDQDDGDDQIVGSWAWSQFDPGFFGDNFRHDRNSGKGSKSIAVTPDVAVSGAYEVFAWWPSTNGRASNVPYTINHAEGADQVTQNQRQNGSQWNSLGTYSFESGAGHNVVVSNAGTNGTVVADAFRFVLVAEDLPPARPGNVVVTATGDTTANVVWADTATDETGFRIERREVGGVFAEAGSVAAGVTSFDDTGLTEGTFYEYQVTAFNAVGDSTPSAIAQVLTTGGNVDGPYNGLPVVVPGVIQAEEFDLGEAGVAYSDTTAGNLGGEFRTDVDVDIEATTDTGGGFNLSFLAPGEFVNYTVDVDQAGFYDIDIRVANGGAGGQFSLFFNGVKTTASITMPNTGGFQDWQTVTVNDVFLSAGEQVMGLVMENSPFGGGIGNINYFQFNLANAQPIVEAGGTQQIAVPGEINLVGSVTDDGIPTLLWTVLSGPAGVTLGDDTAAATTATFTQPGVYTLRLTADDGAFLVFDDVVIEVASPQDPFGGVARDLTSRIEFEDYDLGGQGVAYNDTTPANQGTADPRSGDGVDLETTSDVDGNLNVGFVQAGEWLEYTVAASSSNLYTAEVRAAASGTGGVFHLEIDGVDISGPIAVPDTGGFQTWQTVLVPNLNIPVGSTQILRVAFDTNGTAGFVGNFNWLTFTEQTQANLAPTASAGADEVVFVGNTLTLAGTASDDGLPTGTLTTNWTVESAPPSALVVFGEAATPTSTVSFDTVGTYVLRLTADDGELTGFDELTVTVSQPQVVDLILEAGLSDDVTVIGSWAWSQFDAGFFGDNYRHDRNNGKGSKSVVYTPDVTVEGDYEVYVWYNSTNARATNVPYTVTHANGSDTMIINQRVGGGQWVSLGVYNLLAGSGHGVTLSNDGTNGTVIADAARFELISPNVAQNTAPVVAAGDDAPAFMGVDLNLSGVVNDDGLPANTVTSLWTVIDSPASSVVTFSDNTTPTSIVSFDTVGTYTLRLTADDGELSGFDEVTITVTNPNVNTPPTVDAGIDASALTGASVALDATVTDDGLPTAGVTALWTLVTSPPASVATFGDETAVDTTVSFDTAGTYVLRLTADDSELASFDEVAITVNDPVQDVEIILESGLNDGATVTGNWAWSQFDAGFFGENYRHDRNNGKGSKTASYVPDLPTAGEYELFVQYPSTNARATNVPYTITHDGGTTVVTLNQRQNGGEWVSMGKYNLTPGQGHGIVLSNAGTNGTVVADAARFLLEGSATPTNTAPTVDAGADAANLLNSPLTLSGVVGDDGLPAATLTSTWSVATAPANASVTFNDANAPSTTAALDTAGVYVLRLTVTDGELTSFDELTVTVFDPSANLAPDVDAGNNQTVLLGEAPTLTGSVDDDGLPNSDTTTALWTVISSPNGSAVDFFDATKPNTAVELSDPGVYVLRLTADDTELTAFDEVTITVEDVIDATIFANHRINLGESADLHGQVSGPGAVTAQWIKVSGPGNVVFGNATAADTSAMFDQAGTYVLELTADNGGATDTALITVTVDAAVDLGLVLDSDGADPDVTVVGSWNFSQSDPGFFGNNYRTDTNSGKGSKTVTYTPQLAASGVYEVFVRYTSTNGRATNVPYTVNYAGGSETITLNQRFFGGEWVSLGFYPFFDDGSGSVVISNAGTNGTVVADAVRFDMPETTPTDNFPTSWIVDPTIESPIATYERQAVVVDGKLYAFGGFVEDFDVINRLDVFDPATNQWTTGTPLPEGAAETHVGIAHDGQTIYLVGGFEGDFDDTQDPPQPANNRVWAYDIATDSYTELASLPDLRGNMVAAVVGRELHAFGGNTEDRNTNSADHWVLQLGATDSTSDDGAVWEKRAAVPDARDHASHVVLDGLIYYIGGEFGHDLIHEQTGLLHVYDPTADTWTRLADSPTPKSHAEGSTFSFVHNGRIYFIGGQIGSGSDFSGTREVASYDSSNNTWTVGVPLPVNLQGGMIFPTADGRIIATQGGSTPTLPQSTTWVGNFTPVASLPNHSNAAPTVNAGSDSAVLPNVLLSLDGTVTDDGLPTPGSLTTLWTVESAPASAVVNFGDDTAVDTTASFDTTGTYVLRLTAEDGSLSAFDEVTVTVEEPSTSGLLWQDAADVPFARFEAATITIGTNVYLFGGFYNPAGSILATNRVDVYDASTDTWSQLTDAPLAMTHVQPVYDEINQELWFVGGFDGDDPGPASTVVSIYHIPTDTWSSGPLLPAPRGGGSAALLGRTLHYATGYPPDRNNPSADHWTLDIDATSPTWQSAASFPDPKGHVATAVIGDLWYIIGGETGHDTGPTDQASVHVYDANTGAWTQLADLPYARSHTEPSTFVHEGLIYVAGGRDKQGGRDVIDDLHVYVPGNDTWYELGDLPDELLAPVVTVVDGKLFLTTGMFTNFTEIGESYTLDFNEVLALLPPNTAPTVDAGSDDSVLTNILLSLDGTVTDDGLPTSGSLTTLWSVESVPASGVATFGDDGAVDTTVSFDTAGTYVLRLTANDGALSSFDELTVTVDDSNQSTDIILEAGLSDDVTVIGSWAWSQFDPGFFGENYRHDRNTGKGSKSVVYTPNFPAAGSYEVLVWYNSTNARATNVPYSILHDGGTTDVTINQRIGGGQWVSLGVYDFMPGLGQGVTLSNTGTNGTVVADAMRFLSL